MESALLARLGLSRLRLPVPTAKLAVVHGAAQLLMRDDMGESFWDELLCWIGGLEFESEVLEALCIAVLAKGAKCVETADLQRAIGRPSPLSDLYLGEISGHPLQFMSWGKSHSDEVPPFYRADEMLEELSSGKAVPRILMSRLESLEAESGYPLLKQWAYETQRLTDKYGEQWNGNLEHFLEGESGRSTGLFVTRRGHVARSAYLRTLALAFDSWGMPEERVREEAMYATPADFALLQMLPDRPPGWTKLLEGSAPVSESEWQDFTENLLRENTKKGSSCELLHVSFPLNSTKTYQAECALISLLHEGETPDPKEAFRAHNFLLGRVEMPRSHGRGISLISTARLSLPSERSGQLYPMLVPSIGRHVGYFHSDLLRRIPYLPANICGLADFVARPRLGGMDILAGGNHVGDVSYWNWRWSPASDKALGAQCGVSLSVSIDFLEELRSQSQLRFSRFWCATVLTRDAEYGSWDEKTLYGSI